MATHPCKKAMVAPTPHAIKEDGDGTNHLTKEGGAASKEASLQGGGDSNACVK